MLEGYSECVTLSLHSRLTFCLLWFNGHVLYAGISFPIHWALPVQKHLAAEHTDGSIVTCWAGAKIGSIGAPCQNWRPNQNLGEDSGVLKNLCTCNKLWYQMYTSTIILHTHITYGINLSTCLLDQVPHSGYVTPLSSVHQSSLVILYNRRSIQHSTITIITQWYLLIGGAGV